MGNPWNAFHRCNSHLDQNQVGARDSIAVDQDVLQALYFLHARYVGVTTALPYLGQVHLGAN